MNFYTWEQVEAMLDESRKFLEQFKVCLEQRHIIAAAFQRHIDERHGADFEVCPDPECQRAVVLESDMVYPD